jgi:galactose mutarotase-like enzyme
MILLQNEHLTVSITKQGAELQSIRHQYSNVEYLWQGDPKFWPKRSPVLFPIVGTLKDDTYYHNSVSYRMTRHGFAREMTFALVRYDGAEAIFELKDNDLTRKTYPFEFILNIKYQLRDSDLLTTYQVTNKGDYEMLFSIGGHPAFNVPLVSGGRYEDCYLELEHPETVQRWPLENNLIGKTPVTFLNNEKIIGLSHALFGRDAIVLKGLKSNSIKLKSTKDEHGLELEFPDFPYLGVWAAMDAPFVCIEPWAGIADSVDHDQQLAQKEGINILKPGNVWMRSWKLNFW